MGNEFSLEDLAIILKRRLMFFLLPVLVLAPLGVLVVMLLPAKYTATGLILVESPQVSEDLINTTVIAAQERIQFIQQRVTTRNNLLGIADQYNLFPRKLGLSETERVERMRENLKVKMLNDNAGRRYREEQAIAFTVSYTDKSAQKSHQIASQILNDFQREDNRILTSAASDTTEFFSEETNELRQAIDELERRIAEYKAQYSDALPEHRELHMDTLDRSQRDLIAAQGQERLLQEELGSLEQQLTSYLAGAGAGEGPAQELVRLKSELARLRATREEAHPDVQALKDQIRSIEAQLAPSQAIQSLRTKLQAAEEALREARRADEPDPSLIEELEVRLAEVRDDLSAQVSKEASANSDDLLTAQILGRIDLARNRIESVREQIENFRDTITDMEDRIARTPSVERGLASLTRDRDNLRTDYTEVQRKRSEARMRQNLQQRQKGEKLTILENAIRPEEPSSPDRPKLSVFAILGAFMVGGLSAIGAEALFQTIRGRNHLTNLVGEAPIAIVPYIDHEDDRRGFFQNLLRRRAGLKPQPDPSPAFAGSSATATANG